MPCLQAQYGVLFSCSRHVNLGGDSKGGRGCEQQALYPFLLPEFETVGKCSCGKGKTVMTISTEMVPTVVVQRRSESRARAIIVYGTPQVNVEYCSAVIALLRRLPGCPAKFVVGFNVFTLLNDTPPKRANTEA